MIKQFISRYLERQDYNNNLFYLNSVAGFKEHLNAVIDNLLKDIELSVEALSNISIKMQEHNGSIETELELSYKSLETDEEYKQRLEYEKARKERKIETFKLEAKVLGYTVQEIVNE